MTTILTFIQMQILSCMFIGPVLSCFVPFDGTVWAILAGIGLAATVAATHAVRIRRMFSALPRRDAAATGHGSECSANRIVRV